eukprot:gene8021-9866_t
MDITIEIIINESSNEPFKKIKEQAKQYLIQDKTILSSALGETYVSIKEKDLPLPLSKHIKSLSIFGIEDSFENIEEFKEKIKPYLFIHIYKLSNERVSEEISDNIEESSPYQQWCLPNLEFETLWEKVILFNGPPGSGKTSLAKALAQKISIRHNTRFTTTQLIEINSHSLFSKWFSESGKLVMKVFEKIRELLEDQDCFVVILIDEVESLAAARKAAMNGSEPSDSIRVVNAFLTQLDQLKTFKNSLIITTSNLIGAVDIAFIDRADLKQFIGLPSVEARFLIIKSCIFELLDKEILIHNNYNNVNEFYTKLKELAILSNGLSGRVLRKLPFITFSSSPKTLVIPIQLDIFFDLLNLSILKELNFNKENNSN